MVGHGEYFYLFCVSSGPGISGLPSDCMKRALSYLGSYLALFLMYIIVKRRDTVFAHLPEDISSDSKMKHCQLPVLRPVGLVPFDMITHG